MKSFYLTVFVFFTFTISAQSVWYTTGITDSVISVSGIGDKIWVATQNDGVKILNTNSGAVTTFNMETAGFTTNDFRSIKCLHGKVYAGSYADGMYVYENDTWTHYDSTNSGLNGNSIRDFEYDAPNNILWIATDKGLVTYNEIDGYTVYDSLGSPCLAQDIKCLFLGKENRLWIGTKYSGMIEFVDMTSEWFYYNYDNAGINSNDIRTILEGDNGYLYVADYYGVNKYDIANDDWVFVYNTFTSPISADRVNKMGFTSVGDLWFATHNGVTRVDSANNWTQFYTDNSVLPSNTCDGLFIDDVNRVWVGTYGGLAVYTNPNDIPEKKDDFFVFPNPFTSTVTISSMQPALFSVFSLIGDRVAVSVNENNVYGYQSVTIDLSTQPNGVYFIRSDQTGDCIKVVKI